jgi:spermidine synthase
MSFGIALAAAALCGFISLSYEILWYRAVSLASGGSPVSFGLLLGFYLLGLALGARLAGLWCRKADGGQNRLLRGTAVFVLSANAVGNLVLPTFALFGGYGIWAAALILAMVAAGMFGAVLPLISHFAVEANRLAGRSVAYLYVGNIVGSVLGSFLTGFVLLDVLPLRGIAMLLALLGSAVAIALLLLSRPAPAWLAGGWIGAAIVAGAAIGGNRFAFERFYERLIFGGQAAGLPPFSEVVENRSGVITVTPDGTVFGSGAYDGRISTDLREDRNFIVRAYSVAAFHPQPRRVLMIGLAGGAWAQVVVNHPSVEKLTIVEINPGYLEIIARHPEVASLLRNPKVEVIIDDGRRWLRRNPDRRFDLIVANTTQHWRAHATNLLSVEFLEIVKRHLLPGGVYYFNTTYHTAALKTAMTVFPHGLLVINFAAVSSDPMTFDRSRFRQVLAGYRIDGRAPLDVAIADDAARLDSVVNLRLVVDRERILAGLDSVHLVTDDNMLTEWHPRPERWQ